LDWAEPLYYVIANIQAWIFHRRVVSKFVDARTHSALHPLAYGPVLAVYQIPELNSIHRIESRFRYFVRMKQEAADDPRAIRGYWPKQKRRDVVAGKTDHQIWKAKLTFVADRFFFAQA
jgi:hypothetical protein